MVFVRAAWCFDRGPWPRGHLRLRGATRGVVELVCPGAKPHTLSPEQVR